MKTRAAHARHRTNLASFRRSGVRSALARRPSSARGKQYSNVTNDRRERVQPRASSSRSLIRLAGGAELFGGAEPAPWTRRLRPPLPAAPPRRHEVDERVRAPLEREADAAIREAAAAAWPQQPRTCIADQHCGDISGRQASEPQPLAIATEPSVRARPGAMSPARTPMAGGGSSSVF